MELFYLLELLFILLVFILAFLIIIPLPVILFILLIKAVNKNLKDSAQKRVPVNKRILLLLAFFVIATGFSIFIVNLITNFSIGD